MNLEKLPKLLRPLAEDRHTIGGELNMVENKYVDTMCDHLLSILEICKEINFDNPEDNDVIYFEPEDSEAFFGKVKKLYIKWDSVVMCETVEGKHEALCFAVASHVGYIVHLVLEQYQRPEQETEGDE
jgi:hypothetical protein